MKKIIKEQPIKYSSIKELREDDRPREKLYAQGTNSLSDSELLAILINSGTKGFSAIDAARQLLTTYDNLNKLAAIEINQLTKIKGIGKARAITLKAAFEIAARIEREPFKITNQMNSPDLIANYFIPKFRDKKTESFYVILLNTKNKIIKEVKISEGTLNSSLIHPREVFKPAIQESAFSMILMHNHPSGDPTPSREDITITKTLKESGKILGIEVLDHLIIAGNNYVSLLSAGYI